MTDTHYRSDFMEHGYVLLKGGIPEETLEHLREAAEILFAGVKAGKWTTRHQTVLQPDVFHPAYVEFLNIPEMTAVAKAVYQSTNLMSSGLACLLGSPKNEICKWHRDHSDTHPEMPEILTKPCTAIQINASIYDDQCLWIVPGSHRLSLAEESVYEARFNELEFIGDTQSARAIDENVMSAMPGSMNVKLTAGDILMYSPFLWHAAEYKPEVQRATLHGGMRLAENVDRYTCCRWGLEHNPWLEDPSYMGDLGEIYPAQLALQMEYARKYPEGAEAAY
ncbi:MAG: phytanoyl-CoA dioxygenase family protein [Planctomycetes bacterium]|nr:phytanoyl-CoA dioxygenase family protein [Planctomycetota bacterium]